MKSEKQQIHDIVETEIEDMFNLVAGEFELKSGDIGPDDSNELDDIKEELEEILARYIANNK